MREQLLLLLDKLKTPEFYLILEANANGYLWKRFKKPSKKQNPENYSRHMIEEAVVNIYLAYLAQMCQSKVFTADQKLVTYNARRVLCPEAFLDYMKNPKRRTLSEIIKTVNIVCLEPGIWQNRGKVLKWQASLAVSRKQGKQFEPVWIQTIEHQHYNSNLPPAYFEVDQLPAYSNKSQPPAY